MKLVNNSQAKPKLTIEFEPEELDALYAVLMAVGGDPDRTGRKYTNDLVYIIGDAGYKRDNNPYYDDDGNNSCDGGIYFTK